MKNFLISLSVFILILSGLLINIGFTPAKRDWRDSRRRTEPHS